MRYLYDEVGKMVDSVLNHIIIKYGCSHKKVRKCIQEEAKRGFQPISWTPKPIHQSSLTPHLSEFGPVLTRCDINDFGKVDFVADPFVVKRDGSYHLFFEIYNSDREPDAVIGHAKSKTLTKWRYDRIVLKTDSHLSFPYVFEWKDNMYMIPESTDESVTLYKATQFPHEWKPIETPVSLNVQTQDAVAFRWNSLWWIAVSTAQEKGKLYLFYSDDLETTDWASHKQNPVVEDRPHAVRPAGRPLIFEDFIQFFYQDCSNRYGERVNSLNIIRLNGDIFTEQEADIKEIVSGSSSSFGWNSGRMHHIDPSWTGRRWVCLVDGDVANSFVSPSTNWSIGICVNGVIQG